MRSNEAKNVAYVATLVVAPLLVCMHMLSQPSRNRSTTHTDPLLRAVTTLRAELLTVTPAAPAAAPPLPDMHVAAQESTAVPSHCTAVAHLLQLPRAAVVPPRAREATPIIFCDSKGGRLGNQLFAYAAAFGVAASAGGLPLIPGKHSHYVCDAFPGAKGCDLINASERLEAVSRHAESGAWEPTTWWPLSPSTSHAIDGYRQTWAYLATHEHALRRALKFDAKIEQMASQLLQASVSRALLDDSTLFVSLYHRQGDAYSEAGSQHADCLPGKAFYTRVMTTVRAAHPTARIVALVSSYKSNARQRNALFIEGSRLANVSIVPLDHPDAKVVMAALSRCPISSFSFGSMSWWISFLSGGTVYYDAGLMRTHRGGCAALHKIDLKGQCGGPRSVASFIDAHIPPVWIGLGGVEQDAESGCNIASCQRPEIESAAKSAAKSLGRAGHQQQGVRSSDTVDVPDKQPAGARTRDTSAAPMPTPARKVASPTAPVGRSSRRSGAHARPKPRRSDQAFALHRLDRIFVLNAASRLDRWTHAKCGVLNSSGLESATVERVDARSPTNSNCTPPYSMEDCCTSSHLSLMREWARRASADPHRWALILEDDVVLHPVLRPTNLIDDINGILRAAARHNHSFVYFGSCAPQCGRARNPSPKGVSNAPPLPPLPLLPPLPPPPPPSVHPIGRSTSRREMGMQINFECGSHCTHSYALTAELAARLPRLLLDVGEQLKDARDRTIDQALRCASGVPLYNRNGLNKCPAVESVNMAVVGGGSRNKGLDEPLRSGWKSDHWGPFVQDLDLAISGGTLTPANAQATLKRFKLDTAPSIFFSMRFTGRVGNLMFCYATLLGFAKRFNGAIRHLKIEESTDVPAATFFREFGLPEYEVAIEQDALAMRATRGDTADGARESNTSTLMAGPRRAPGILYAKGFRSGCTHTIREHASQIEDQSAYCSVDAQRYGRQLGKGNGGPEALPCAKRLFVLEGYWQSYKYFAHAEDSVRSAFVFSKRVRFLAMQVLRKARAAHHRAGATTPASHDPLLSASSPGASAADGVRVVGVQIRLGDKVGHPVYQPTSAGYYGAAIRLARRRFASKGITSLVFVVTSDDPHTARTMLRAQGFHSAEVSEREKGPASSAPDVNHTTVFVTDQKAVGSSPYVDIAVLAACDALVIGPSSLGWWAGYLSVSAEFVISPRELFVPGTPLHKGFNSHDYFPPQWTLLQNDGRGAE